jgi:site-specific DNA-methyltransferase (adenine-specific)
MVNKALFSSSKTEWETPEELYMELDEEFDFLLDPCATKWNSKCLFYIDEEQNGLTTCWYSYINDRSLNNLKFSVFVNPPYGRGLTEKWVMKAWLESKQHGLTVVMLLPSRTDQWWFREICLKYGEVRFLPKRVKFIGASSGAPFPSIVVVFRGGSNVSM